MRWNLNWERYNEGGKVENTMNDSPHSQIDLAIQEGDTYIPLSKLGNLIETTGIPIQEASKIMSMIPVKKGESSDQVTKHELDKVMSIKEIINEMISDGSINNIIGNMLPKEQPNVPEVKANVPKPNPMVQGFNKGGQVQPQFPAFNMPSNRRAKVKPAAQGVNPAIPKTTPAQNLGMSSNEAMVSANSNKYRPKKKTPVGVPNPKPYNPFSQQMNTLV